MNAINTEIRAMGAVYGLQATVICKWVERFSRCILLLAGLKMRLKTRQLDVSLLAYFC
jgi:hypothetical protein